MKKVFILLIICFSLVGCSSKQGTNHQNPNDAIQKIMAENKYVILDVRTKEEYNEGHVVGAMNIPYDQIDASISIDQDTVILVYCKSGNRSNIAFQTLTNLGYSVYDLGAFQSITLPKE